MTPIDWICMLATLGFIIAYGLYKNRNDRSLDAYLLGNQSLPWYHVGLSVMATQASAITFLSAPGQAYTDGMRFLQFYFGLPLAMIVLCITFIPIFHRLKVYTAYEYLETRFDAKTRVFTSILFLLSRGLSTGISIYAPSIILATILNWDIAITNVIMGGLVLTYTIWGGNKAISHTHLQQMIFVTLAMFLAGYLIVQALPTNIGFGKALSIAKESSKMNMLNFDFDWKDRYNIWSGLIGGFFLQLSYFGTDQSQVSRYLTGESIKQSRMGLLMNGLLKIPMQFLILLIGILVYVLSIFQTNGEIFNNRKVLNDLRQSSYAAEVASLEDNHHKLITERRELVLHTKDYSTQLLAANKAIEANRDAFKELAKKHNPKVESSDVNYVFLRFVLDHLPHGLIGLLIAVIFSASMGSIASAYNSLASTSLVDIYYKINPTKLSEALEVKYVKYFTLAWGVFCILIAQFANRFSNSMIELVNILGSWFYGVILGIFIVAFYFKSIKSNAVFYAAILAEILVIYIWYFHVHKSEDLGFLWLNPIGCIAVVVFGYAFQRKKA